MRARRALRQQPAGFWLGVGLVAEAPMGLGLALLPADFRAQVAAAFASPAGVAAALAGCLLLYFGTAWLAHRLGLGD